MSAWRATAVAGPLALESAPEAIDERTAADFRHEMLQPSQFDGIYAPATTQNHEGEPGLFCFNLARHFDTRSVPDGRYRLEIELRDTRRNASVTETTLTIDNRS